MFNNMSVINFPPLSGNNSSLMSYFDTTFIRFSQGFISDPETVWDISKYEKIQVVQYDDTSVSSFDNRRLYRATKSY